MILLSILCLLIAGLLSIAGGNLDSPDNPTSFVEPDICDINPNLVDNEGYYTGYTTYLPDPTPFTLSQPDGTEFEARRVGEKFGGHVETKNGYTVIKDEAGWWTYAEKDEMGILVPTNNRVGEVNPIFISGLQKHLSNDHPDISNLEEREEPHGTRAPPINTTWKAIAIMLSFQDDDFDSGHDQAHYEDMLNGTTGNTFRTYYWEVSYGQFDIEFDIVGPFQSAHVMAYYGDNQPPGRDNANGSVSEMAKEAVQLADPTVDFSPYDVDGDGWIDALFIIHASSGEEQSGYEFDIWSHKSSTNYATGDGVNAGSYSTEPEDGKIGVFAHEFGHQLGLPDLYDADYGGSGGQSDGIGDWGVMAGGSWNGGGNSPAHFCAWSKVELGWVEPQIVTSDLSIFQIEVPPVWNNSVIYKIWAHDPSQDTTEYFLVENRQRSGFDSFLPGDGILIWHINESAPGNQNPDRLLVDLEEADGNEELITAGGPGGEAGDPWKNTVTGFRNTTTPNSASYNGSDTYVWVWNISDIAPDGNMSIGFNEIYSGPRGIFISDPQSNTTINPVYDFIINDTGFPDEDVGMGNDGINGSYVLELRLNGTSDPFTSVNPQTPLSWVGGGNGVINCTALQEGYWDFRVKILDEEGHLLYTPIVYNIAVPTDIPPVADAGFDNSSDVNVSVVLDGSNSTDNSGFIAWFNWTFDDGTYHNGTDSILTHKFKEPGVYQVILNVSDSFGNWDTDVVNITVTDIGPPVTTLTIINQSYRENVNDNWNVTSNTSLATISEFSLSAVDNYEGVNFTWYIIDGVYFEGTSFDLIGYDEGDHTIEWGSEDMIGNNETGIFMVVCVDNSAPDTSLSIGSPKYRINPNNPWNVTETTLFTLVPYDQYSGISFTWYFTDNQYYGTTFNLSGFNDGFITIIWNTEDNVGNTHLWVTVINLDSTPPVTDVEFGTPKYRAQATDNWNITTTTPITVTDNGDGSGSGINFTWYTIDDVYYEYSAPFTLTAGVHALTWGGMDNLGQNSTDNNQTVNVDVAPPQTILNIAQPKFRGGAGDIWNVSDTTIFTLEAFDLYSGINYSWYIIDGQYFEGSEFNLSGFSEGPHSIAYGSMDNLGHNETGNSTQVHLDITPPTTTMVIGEPKYRLSPLNPWNVTSSTQFSLTSIDSYVGVNATWYTIDSFYYEGTIFDLTGYFDGVHIITWGAYDNLSNNETANILILWLDDTPPITDLNIGMPKYPTSFLYGCNITSSTQFTLSAVDKPDFHNTGVNYTWYTIDGNYYEGTSFNLSIYGEGPHNIFWGSVDYLENFESANSILVWVDDSPPLTDLSVGTPRYPNFPYDGINITSATQLTLSANDKPDLHYSGINFTWYSIDGEYFVGSSFTLSGYGEGFHTIEWGSMDNLGNNETAKSVTIWVDDSQPESVLNISEPVYPASQNDGCNVTSSSQFLLSRSDKPDIHNSGIDFTWYTIDGDFYFGFVFDLSMYGEGMHTITWGSTDLLGHNETGNIITVWVDDLPPETDLTIDTPRYPLSPYEGTNVTSSTQFTLSGDDKPDAHNAGINFTWYTIDGNYYAGMLFTLSGYSEGVHTITWGSTDFLGNNETGNSITIWVDDSKPETDLTIAEPRYPSFPYEGINVTSSTIFTLSGMDKPDAHYAGMDFTWFTIDSDYYTGTSFTLLGYGEGMHTVTWGSIDNLGQNETGNSVMVWVDDSEPETLLSMGMPRYPLTPYDRCNATSSTQFTLSGSDKPDLHNTEINFTWYTIDGVYFVGTSFFLSGYGEGMHTITWGSEDRLGHNETGNIITVWVDDSPPETELTIGSPRHPLSPADGSNVTSSTQITLSGIDKPDSHNTGVSFTWYSIDGIYYPGTSFTLSGYGEGAHTIAWGSEDRLENNETGNSITIWLDDSPPISDMIIGDPKYRMNDWDNWNVTVLTPFTIGPFDQFSGVNSSWYTINGNYFEGNSFNLSGYDEGLYTITFGSLDNLGWNETNPSETVNLNFTSLVTVLTIDTPKYRDHMADSWNVTSQTEFTLTVIVISNDPEFTWYTIDGEYFEYQGTPFTLAGLIEGAHEITWGSQDDLGYNESYNLITVVLDDSGPQTTIDVAEPRHREFILHHWNVTHSSIFTLSPTDQYSGVNYTWYRIDGDYFEGTEFDLSGYAEGEHTITWASVDNLGNNEATNAIRVILDASTPTTSLNIDFPKYRVATYNLWNVTSDTQFLLISSDLKSGVDTWWYTIDGKYVEGDTFYLTNLNDGEHIITWGAIDNLGNNETANTTVVVLDNSPPETEIDIGQPQYRGNSGDYWNITDTTSFSLISSDLDSGVSHTWYTVDGDYFEASEFDLFGFEDGLHLINWGGVDNLGNNESGNTIRVYLDTTSPDTNLDIGSPQHQKTQGGTWYITSETSLSLIPFDQHSGVSYTWYAIDGKYNLGTLFKIQGNDRSYSITWGSLDNLGNNETGNSVTVYLDNTPPVMSHKIGDPNWTVEGVLHIATSTPITLDSFDSGVGDTTIHYYIDGSGEFSVYESPFKVPNSTISIVYYGVDALGNSANVSTFLVTVDIIDTDGDRIEDFRDTDDDNDGLLDRDEEDLGTDPLNPDTDGDGYNDNVDKYPLDEDRYREPTDWEKIPFIGEYEQSFCINFLIIGIIVLIILILMYKGIKRWRAGASWKKEPKAETPIVVSEEPRPFDNVQEVVAEPAQISWEQSPPPPPPSQK